ncbi:hypothetical protein [[Mycobacterium] zoologicum]|uniref:hypothetical protein n=1 Tax=[Mycobacterium] zoologicum TaxID=2872311 RepID=UPI001CDA5EEB|nr:hypothetical protein [Mycolicibacter sp. MYC101]MEB3062485.1 hypothetical protein [Mycolicibacter sp. MYC101]
MTDSETQLGTVEPTEVVEPVSVPDNGYGLAWEIAPPEPVETELERRPLTRTLLGLLGFVAVGGLMLGAFITGTRVQHRADVGELRPIIETTTVTATPSAAEVLNAQNDKLLDAAHDAQLPLTSDGPVTVVNARAFCDYLATGHRTLHDQDGFVQGLYPGFNGADVGSFEGMTVGIMCPRFVPLYQPGSDGTS